MSEFVSEENIVCWEKDLINYRYIKNFKPQIWTISKIHNFIRDLNFIFIQLAKDIEPLVGLRYWHAFVCCPLENQ